MFRKHILVAVDLLAADQSVLRLALELVHDQGALLTVLHVVEDVSPDTAETIDNEELRSAREFALEHAYQQVDILVLDSDPGRANWSTRVETGSPPICILRVAEELGADLIVLGAGRSRSLRAKVIGSTADRVVRNASMPVLVVKRRAEGPYRKAIAALDLSPASELVVDIARSLYRGANLQLVHIVHVPLTFEQAMLRVGAGQAKMAAYRQTLVERAQARLNDLASRCAASGTAPKVSVLEGDPADTLLRLSRARDLDLIVVGPHGHGVVLRALLGSVALRLLSEAACDVLIVPHEES